jgi:DMSO/TMAO reductase YedYZ heme-binding membrane subunit
VTGAAASGEAQRRAAIPTPARLTTARQRRMQLIQPADVTKGFATAVAEAWRQHRLEVLAVALLAIAGLIFPAPIWLVGFLLWLIGSALVLSSKMWSVGEKWLTVPGLVVLVIAGIAVAEALGGKRQDAAAYGDEALTVAATLFKIAMLLAAVYLGWRMQRGHRAPPMPSWHRRQRR